MESWVENNYGLLLKRTTEQPQPGFSRATVMRLRQPTNEESGDTFHDFCLRRWPPQSLSRARLTGLHRLLRHISLQGISEVAVPLTALNGATLCEFEGALWQLEPWLPGTASFHQQPSSARLKSAFELLARWHLAAKSFVPANEEAEWFRTQSSAIPAAVTERRAKFRSLLNGGLTKLQQQHARASRDAFFDTAQNLLLAIRTHAANILQQLDFAASRPVAVQPCLRDVWHDHVLFVDDKASGIVDPSACRTENVASDVSRLLGSLVEDDASAREVSLAAYQTVRPLSDDEQFLISVLDRSGVLLSGQTWLQRIYLHNQTIAQPERVLARMQMFVRRAERIKF